MINGSESPAKGIPENLAKNFEVVEQSYTLSELTKLKEQWVEEVKIRSQKVIAASKCSAEYLEKLLNEAEAAMFNRSMIKECISIGNLCIYGDIYYRETHRDLGRILQKVEEKHRSKSDAAVQELVSKLKRRSNANRTLSEGVLTGYNGEVKMTVGLLKLD